MGKPQIDNVEFFMPSKNRFPARADREIRKCVNLPQLLDRDLSLGNEIVVPKGKETIVFIRCHFKKRHEVKSVAVICEDTYSVYEGNSFVKWLAKRSKAFRKFALKHKFLRERVSAYFDKKPKIVKHESFNKQDPVSIFREVRIDLHHNLYIDFVLGKDVPKDATFVIPFRIRADYEGKYPIKLVIFCSDAGDVFEHRLWIRVK